MTRQIDAERVLAAVRSSTCAGQTLPSCSHDLDRSAPPVHSGGVDALSERIDAFSTQVLPLPTGCRLAARAPWRRLARRRDQSRDRSWRGVGLLHAFGFVMLLSPSTLSAQVLLLYGALLAAGTRRSRPARTPGCFASPLFEIWSLAR